MASWLVKAGVQGVSSRLPGALRVNALMQRYVTGRGALTDQRFEAKLTHARRHLRRYGRVGERQRPRSALELGTGWYPVVPVAMSLCGVRRVASFDIQPLTDAARVRKTLERFVAYRDSGRLRERLPGARPRRLARLDECLAEGSLAPLGVELVVGDRPIVAWQEDGFDLVVSDNTLEHIPPDALRRAFEDLFALATPGAVMDHFIDMRDHYADVDPNISRLNFLRYSDSTWRLFNNRLQYLNRLRLPEYRDLVTGAGFRIAEERPTTGRDGEFDDLRLAPRFRAMPRDEALVLYAWITATKPG